MEPRDDDENCEQEDDVTRYIDNRIDELCRERNVDPEDWESVEPIIDEAVNEGLEPYHDN